MRIAPTFLLLPCLLAPMACADSRLPVLAIPLSEATSFGTDLNVPDSILGITVTDPLHRMHR
ncbi:MAG: hypothetical protein R3D90_15175 [Paracoccaceae bacterium]